MKVWKQSTVCVHFEARGLCAVQVSVNVAVHAAGCNCRLPVSAPSGERLEVWGAEKPILQSKTYRTLIQFNRCQPWACVGASVEKMNRSNKSTWTERNRWGLFFINGVGVKLAGWAPCSNTLDWVPGVFGLCLSSERRLGCTAVKRLRAAQSMWPISLNSYSLNFTQICQGGWRLRIWLSKPQVRTFKRRFKRQFVMTCFECPFDLHWFSYSCC